MDNFGSHSDAVAFDIGIRTVPVVWDFILARVGLMTHSGGHVRKRASGVTAGTVRSAQPEANKTHNRKLSAPIGASLGSISSYVDACSVQTAVVSAEIILAVSVKWFFETIW